MTRAWTWLAVLALVSLCNVAGGDAQDGAGARSNVEDGQRDIELTLAFDAVVPLPLDVELRPKTEAAKSDWVTVSSAPAGFSAAVEWAFHQHMLVGARAGLCSWLTSVERALGSHGRLSIDYSALIRGRVVLAGAPGMRGLELFFAVPAGFSLVPGGVADPVESVTSVTAPHVGLLSGVKFPRRLDSVGSFLLQGGVIYRHVKDQLTFENEAGDTAVFHRTLPVATVQLSVGFVFEL